ncbi:hypothetical protein OnM2_092044 [Erysiphe neolycopersici]|uniref:Uncharacterized protein n=1 Tax=Erysiphe neolycopersici TaxID=212602 RepID=A0A420HCF1_9PEZI|nr:hypothetical protein OnM2_092044 [Erysiphe neolycopersici]
MFQPSSFSSGLDTSIASSQFRRLSFSTNNAQLGPQHSTKSACNNRRKRYISSLFSRATTTTAIPANSANNSIFRPVTLESAKTTWVFRYFPFISTTNNRTISNPSALPPPPYIGLLRHSDANPDIVIARERVQNAEAVEEAARRSLQLAHAAVGEAREHVRLLERRERVEWQRN